MRMKELAYMGLGFLLIGANLNAGELLLGAAGKSNYQIVIPDKSSSKKIALSIEKAAKLCQKAFKENGMTIPVVTEAKLIPEKPGIYLGKTKFALKNGVDFAKMKGWTYTFKVVGKNLIIAGNDQMDPIPYEKRMRKDLLLRGINLYATLKGATEFLYKYAGVRFLRPGKFGIAFMPTPIIFIPDDLNMTRRPNGKAIETPRSHDIYFTATAREPSPLIFTHYGHYHCTALTSKSHGKSNPEYFILAGGKRDVKGRHHCFSNKNLRELIYKKILNDCDLGYEIIEVGQNDGFRPCECKKCYELYGVHPTRKPLDSLLDYQRDPAWGEKLWIMHRDMALRLKKDRPNKKLLLSAYAVAQNPPTTFNKFPDNVIIQVMHPSKELMEKWHKLDVPGGFCGYTYTWGTYHAVGLTPLRSDWYIKNLLKVLEENNIQYTQDGGKPYTYGIEGINIYAFNRKVNDPKGKSVDELNREYIQAAYREAAGPMRIFHRKMHYRLNFMYEAMIYGYSKNRDPMLVFSTIYSPGFINELDAQLKKAEKIVKDPSAEKRLSAVRLEFDYLKHITDTIYLYYAYQVQKDERSLKLAVDAVERRNKWLKTLMKKGTGIPRRDLPALRQSLRTMLSNGRYMNIEPFNWNIAKMRATGNLKKSVTAKSLMVKKINTIPTINSKLWKNVKIHKLGQNRGVKDKLAEKTTFQVAYDKNNLYIRFEAGLRKEDMKYHSRGRDAEIWLQECINICLAVGGDKSQYYYLNFEPIADSYTDANHGFITDFLHPKFGWNDNAWNGDWTYDNILQKDKNRWLAMVTLPFKIFNTKTPLKGDIWYGNFGRVHYYDNKNKRELAVWEDKLNISRTPSEGYFGEMVFE